MNERIYRFAVVPANETGEASLFGTMLYLGEASADEDARLMTSTGFPCKVVLVTLEVKSIDLASDGKRHRAACEDSE